MGYTAPRTALSTEKPIGRVLSTPVLLSTGAQVAVVMMFQLIGLAALRSRPGYQRSEGSRDIQEVASPENFVVYTLGLAQFMIVVRMYSNVDLMLFYSENFGCVVYTLGLAQFMIVARMCTNSD